MNTTRRVGRFTKHETAELRRMFEEGYSVYKICRNLNRSQKSIRNNLIRLGEIEGEITPRRYTTKSNDVVVDDSISSLILNYTWNTFTLSFLTMVFVLNPHYNILEIMLTYFFILWFWFKENRKIKKYISIDNYRVKAHV